ncbi:MAG TPA: Hsp20/alpha crystallin family protein [Gemmatimonadales bacterium]|jgi:HSP20 family protein
MKLMKAAPMPALRREFDTMFERLFRSPLFPELPVLTAEAGWEPALDLTEAEKEFLVRLEVPGFHRENLDVKYESGVLTIAGTREFRTELKGEEFLWQERAEGRFVRSIRIPAPVIEGEVVATYENGVLTVKLPKHQPTAKAKIAIK